MGCFDCHLTQPPVFSHFHVPRLILVVEKRSALLVSGRRRLSSKPGTASDGAAAEEERSHANEGKDPLEGDDLVEELANTESSGEDTEGETDGVVL
jgi:hypothetical protein